MVGMGTHLIQFPSKRWGFVGTVDVRLMWSGAPAEIEQARRLGPGFAKVKMLAWETREDALAAAASIGVEVQS